MKYLPLFGLLAFTGGLSAPAFAESASEILASKAGVYDVETAHTQVIFSLTHMGFSYYWGTFSEASGKLTLKASDIAASTLKITIPIDSVSTTSAKLTGLLKGPQWFDVAQFGTAVFTSTKVTASGADRATIDGDLSLHGVTHPVSLSVHFIGAGVNPFNKKYTVGFEGTSVIKRSDFGVKAYLPMVGDDVRLSISGEFERQD